MASETMSTSTSTSTTSSSSMTTRATSTPPPALFNPGASPPLILAFLAIGLFTISMIAVFGWRRVRTGRQIGILELEGMDGERRRRDIGEKPRLWDLWSDGAPTGTGEKGYSWETITPVAVTMIPDAPENRHHQPLDRPQQRSIHSYYARLSIRRPPPRTASTDTDVKVDPVPEHLTLQVAVAIAMPSPPHNNKTQTNHRHVAAPDDTSLPLDYTLGLCRLRQGVREGKAREISQQPPTNSR